MSYYIYVNELFSVDFTDLGILSSNKINPEKIGNDICRGVFKPDNIIDCINQCSFSLYFEENSKIKGIICVTNYDNTKYWEITYICVSADKKGLGTELLNKLKNIAKKNVNADKQVIVIYGMGTTDASSNLYIKNGFKDKKYVVKYNTDGGNKTKRKYKKKKNTKKRKSIFYNRKTRLQKKFV